MIYIVLYIVSLPTNKNSEFSLKKTIFANIFFAFLPLIYNSEGQLSNLPHRQRSATEAAKKMFAQMKKFFRYKFVIFRGDLLSNRKHLHIYSNKWAQKGHILTQIATYME